MKNLFFTLAFLFSFFYANSQWSYENVDNGFDDSYRIAYTKANNGAILKLENVEGDIFFYIQGKYYCDEYPLVDLVFVVNGVNVKYSLEGFKSKDDSAIFFMSDLINSEILKSFQKCTVLKVRVNESYCSSETYSFNMSKSTSALNYMQYK
jgi:hypothetical protein